MADSEIIPVEPGDAGTSGGAVANQRKGRFRYLAAPAARRSKTARRIFVVVGMHRSGTSLLSNMLHYLGADMADETDHVSGKNAKGFWERPVLNALQDDVLKAIGCPIGAARHTLPPPAGWWRRKDVQAIKMQIKAYMQEAMGDAEFWGFKDPRTCRLLPLWREIFQELGLAPTYVVAVRAPGSAAISMRNKNPAQRPMTVLQSEMLWLAYNYDILRHLGTEGFVTVNYDDWFADPSGVARFLADRLGLGIGYSESEIQKIGSGVVDGQLRHFEDGEARVAAAMPISDALFRLMRSLGEDGTDDLSHLDRQVATLDMMFNCFKPVVDLLDSLPQRDASEAALRAEVEALKAAAAEAATAAERDAGTIAALKQDVARNRQKRERADLATHTMAQEVEARNARIAALEAELASRGAEAARSVSDAAAERKAAETRLASTLEELDDVRKRLTEETVRVCELEANVVKHRTLLADAISNDADLKASLTSMSAALSYEQERADRAEAQSSELTLAFKARDVSLEIERKTSAKKIAAGQTQLKTSRAEIRNAKLKIVQLEQKLSQKTSAAADAVATAEHLSNILSAREAEILANGNAWAEVEGQLILAATDAAAENAQLRDRLSKMRENLRAEREAAAEARAELRKLSSAPRI